MKNLKTDFDPLVHGYKFINRFDLKQLLPSIKLKKHLFWGLCGGMVYSVLDSFYSKLPIPDFTNVENLPLSFVEYLWSRQTDSVSIRTISKLIINGLSSNKRNIFKTINNEIPLIIESVSLNQPLPVVIIRNNFIKNPIDNHQVLIVGLEIYGPLTKLNCYDPNHPRIIPYILVDRTSGKEKIIQSTGEVVRGLFINKYKLKKPRSF